MSEEAFIYEAIRTPRGKQRNGALNEVKPVSLVVGLIEEMRSRHPDLDENLISDVILGVRFAGRRSGRRHRPHRRTGGQAAGDHRRIPAEPLLRLGSGGRQPRRAEGALGLGRPGVRRRRRVDEPRPDGLRRRRVGQRPRDQLPHRLRAAGHRRRPDRHHRGLLPRGRRPLRAAQSRRRPPRPGRAATSPSPSSRSSDQNGLVILDHDEHMRPDTTLEGLGKLKTAFDGIGAMGGFDDVALQKYHYVEKINHIHTGGNSSGIVDGAAARADRQREGRPVAGPDAAGTHRGHRHQRRGSSHHADRPDPGHQEGARPRRTHGRRHRPVRDSTKRSPRWC